MTERFEVPGSRTQPIKPKPLGDEPGFVDGIPVEELVRLTREFTNRINNEDRQRVALEVNESRQSIQSSAPFVLQQFFAGKTDLDIELAKRYPGPPLLASTNFSPEPGKQARHGFAQFSGQDGSASLTFELHGPAGSLEVSYLLYGMIGVRFTLGTISDNQRRRFLELMRRPTGIAFLWTKERWERDYLIFVVRERFARIYAFGPGRFDAACRLPPEVLEKLLVWLSAFWVTDTDTKPDDRTATGTFTW